MFMQRALLCLLLAGCPQSTVPPTSKPVATDDGQAKPAEGSGAPVTPAIPPVVPPTPITPTSPPVAETTPTTPAAPADGGRRAFPECLQAKYDAYVSGSKKGDPAANVTRYRYNSQTVWTIPSPCCDQFNYVYDTACNVICAPSGGITGRGDGKCPDFLIKATDKIVVWPRATR